MGRTGLPGGWIPFVLWTFAAALGACSGPSASPDGGGDADLPDADLFDADARRDADTGDAAVLDAEADAEADGGLDAGADADVEREPCPEGWAETFEEPTELRMGVGFTGTFPRCASAQRFAVLSSGTTARVTVTGLPAGTALSVIEMTGDVLGSAYSVDGTAEVEFSPTWSGEVRIRLQRPDGADESEYVGRLACVSGCSLEATRYPIVLVHGLAGTDSYFGLFDYWYEVVPTLEEQGYLVYTPVTELIASSESRAPILAEAVDAYLEETGASKLHFLGHSQGGLDIRVLLTGLGYADRAATVTTLATPHAGLRIEIPEFLAGQDFSESYMTGEFAARYPAPAGVPIFSWAGRTCGALELDCQEELDGELVSFLFVATHPLIREAHADDAYEGANDGLVPVASAVWGEFLGILPADHVDEIGQIAGATQGPHDHLAWFLAEARRLRDVEIVRGL